MVGSKRTTSREVAVTIQTLPSSLERTTQIRQYAMNDRVARAIVDLILYGETNIKKIHTTLVKEFQEIAPSRKQLKKQFAAVRRRCKECKEEEKDKEKEKEKSDSIMPLAIRMLDGLNFTVDVSLSDTVLRVKEIIHETQKVAEASLQQLIHSGRVLADTQTLEEAGVKDTDFLVLTVFDNSTDVEDFELSFVCHRGFHEYMMNLYMEKEKKREAKEKKRKAKEKKRKAKQSDAQERADARWTSFANRMVKLENHCRMTTRQNKAAAQLQKCVRENASMAKQAKEKAEEAKREQEVRALASRSGPTRGKPAQETSPSAETIKQAKKKTDIEEHRARLAVQNAEKAKKALDEAEAEHKRAEMLEIGDILGS